MLQDYQFGSITINGKKYSEDVLVINGKVKSWWRKKGHKVVMEDLAEALRQEPEIMVIGTGESGLVKISQEVKELLDNRGIKLITKPTALAVSEFNNLKDKKVVGLFHLTC